MSMFIEIYEAIEAQPLDEEGDPKGDKVTLQPGKYRLVSVFDKCDDGSASVWVEDQGQMYEAHGLRPS